MMKFRATIRTAEGGTRVLDHESRFDATSVLVDEIDALLEPGESIKLTGSRHESGPPNRRTQVPDIVRVAP
jgi:hypothetical protein